jgi:hypothetical protein
VGRPETRQGFGRLYCRNEGREGTIYLVEANPKEYAERGRFNPPERTME